jgi:hypothetical protein
VEASYAEKNQADLIKRKVGHPLAVQHCVKILCLIWMGLESDYAG